MNRTQDDLNNPFSDSKDYLEPDVVDDTTPNASTASVPYHQQASNYTSSSSAPARGLEGDDASARLAEIRRREEELARREANLGQREAYIRVHGRNNWPPKPFWPFAPLIFHDIQQEIPEESRSIVTTLYRLWLILILTLTLNTVACILLLVSGAADGAKDMGGSIVDLLVIPLAFLLWYR